MSIFTYRNGKGGRTSNFSLVELLIVVAVISILMSMLLPALNGAREFARRTSCTGNLKQLGALMWQYADDYNGVMPCVWTSSSYVYWTDHLYRARYLIIDNNDTTPYSYNCKLLRCPSDRDVSSNGLNYYSYGMNYLLSTLVGLPSGASNNDRCNTYIKTTKISKLSQRILLGDADDKFYGILNVPVAGKSSSDIISGFRHNGSIDYVFMDGHCVSAPYPSPYPDWQVAFGASE